MLPVFMCFISQGREKGELSGNFGCLSIFLKIDFWMICIFQEFKVAIPFSVTKKENHTSSKPLPQSQNWMKPTISLGNGCKMKWNNIPIKQQKKEIKKVSTSNSTSFIAEWKISAFI